MILRIGYLPIFWTSIEHKVNTCRVKEPKHGWYSDHPEINGFRMSETIDFINAELLIRHTMGLLAWKRSLKLTCEQFKIQYNMMKKASLTIVTIDRRSVSLRILWYFSHQKSSLNLILMTLHDSRGRSLAFYLPFPGSLEYSFRWF